MAPPLVVKGQYAGNCSRSLIEHYAYFSRLALTRTRSMGLGHDPACLILVRSGRVPWGSLRVGHLCDRVAAIRHLPDRLNLELFRVPLAAHGYFLLLPWIMAAGCLRNTGRFTAYAMTACRSLRITNGSGAGELPGGSDAASCCQLEMTLCDLLRAATSLVPSCPDTSR